MTIKWDFPHTVGQIPIVNEPTKDDEKSNDAKIPPSLRQHSILTLDLDQVGTQAPDLWCEEGIKRFALQPLCALDLGRCKTERIVGQPEKYLVVSSLGDN